MSACGCPHPEASHWAGMTGDMKPHFCMGLNMKGCASKCIKCPLCGSKNSCECYGDL